ncbi:hypothetical protein [uncultured Parolsenella sp.]|uniref:hypothetical protein n=1 Tax=uncultured Parolsenella sp. TaxID=2083008 RepID=UPI002658E044|nr:hypothetical protein [uncultured Parolsenella sp.]
MRRKGFEEFPLLRGHEDELLAVTGELARVLPTRTEYRLHTGEEWDDAAALGSEALARRAVIENPAQTFVWEVRHNPSGMLAASSNREYKWALESTNAICDLWESNAVASEAELAKALIVQTVLRDDDLRAEVLKRAGALARTAAGTLGPYFSDWKR